MTLSAHFRHLLLFPLLRIIFGKPAAWSVHYVCLTLLKFQQKSNQHQDKLSNAPHHCQHAGFKIASHIQNSRFALSQHLLDNQDTCRPWLMYVQRNSQRMQQIKIASHIQNSRFALSQHLLDNQDTCRPWLMYVQRNSQRMQQIQRRPLSGLRSSAQAKFMLSP